MAEQRGSRFSAFNLIELLVVIAVIAILIALLSPVLFKSKEQAQSASCQNHLHQIGLAIEMYVSDHNVYPNGLGGEPLQTWAEQLAPYDPVAWTNAFWQCPRYMAEGGIVLWQPPPPTGGDFEAFSGYAYNSLGMLGRRVPRSGWLGLGELNVKVPDDRIVAPSEMYAVGDTRAFEYRNAIGFHGWILMRPWNYGETAGTEAKPPHAGGYNMLFADSHVSLVKRRDYLYPPRSAQNWNHDHQPHPEFWAPTNQWAVQE